MRVVTNQHDALMDALRSNSASQCADSGSDDTGVPMLCPPVWMLQLKPCRCQNPGKSRCWVTDRWVSPRHVSFISFGTVLPWYGRPLLLVDVRLCPSGMCRLSILVLVHVKHEDNMKPEGDCSPLHSIVKC